MVEQDSDALSDIFKAASDPTRRAVLTILVQEGPMRVPDLAARFDMSLNAVSKHIRVLEQAGLVSRETRWREHLIAAQLDRTRLIDAWFSQLRSAWELRLTRLQDVLEEKTK